MKELSIEVLKRGWFSTRVHKIEYIYHKKMCLFWINEWYFYCFNTEDFKKDISYL